MTHKEIQDHSMQSFLKERPFLTISEASTKTLDHLASLISTTTLPRSSMIPVTSVTQASLNFTSPLVDSHLAMALSASPTMALASTMA